LLQFHNLFYILRYFFKIPSDFYENGQKINLFSRTIPARFGLIWFSGFRGEDLNVIFYQNMPNLHNWYKSAERKISNKNPEHMLNYSLPCKLQLKFELILTYTKAAMDN
jgi:hypothetical protein